MHQYICMYVHDLYNHMSHFVWKSLINGNGFYIEQKNNLKNTFVFTKLEWFIRYYSKKYIPYITADSLSRL